MTCSLSLGEPVCLYFRFSSFFVQAHSLSLSPSHLKQEKGENDWEFEQNQREGFEKIEEKKVRLRERERG